MKIRGSWGEDALADHTVAATFIDKVAIAPSKTRGSHFPDPDRIAVSWH